MNKWLLVLILCCLCLPLRAGISYKIEKPGVVATLEDPFDLNPQTGVLPLRLTIENTSSVSTVYQLNVDSGSSDSDTVKLGWTGSYTVDKNSKHSFWIYLPIPAPIGTESRWTCTFSGPTFSDAFPSFYNHVPDRESKNFLVLLYSPDVGLKLPPTIWDIRPGEKIIRSECALNMFPDDWHGYLGVRSIFITSASWKTLKEEQRRAILQYVGLGGRLLVFGPVGELEGDQLNVAVRVAHVDEDGMQNIPFGIGDLIICDERKLQEPFWLPGKVEKETW